MGSTSRSILFNNGKMKLFVIPALFGAVVIGQNATEEVSGIDERSRERDRPKKERPNKPHKLSPPPTDMPADPYAPTDPYAADPYAPADPYSNPYPADPYAADSYATEAYTTADPYPAT